MNEATGDAEANLNFKFTMRKNGEVDISREGRTVTILRGRAAATFLAKVENASAHTAQQLMARVTGNYKRGNERLAKGHGRNRVDT